MRAFVLLTLMGCTPCLTAHAALLTYNSAGTADVAATRDAWLSAIGITSPQYLVDFESGFTDGQNISGVTGLFPVGLVITDTSASGSVLVEATAGGINGSNPIGGFAITQNEQAYLELDFSLNPVDYVGFRDIDHTGTTGVVTFVGGGTANVAFETTGSAGNTAEFFGIFRNDLPKITRIQLDASGSPPWGLDNIEYGVQVIPVPAAAWLLGSGLAALGFLRRSAGSAARAAPACGP